jgi:signal peptidase II
MNRVHRIWLIALLLLSTAGCDQISKRVARAELSSSEPVSILKGLIKLEYDENHGAFLSIGENLPAPIFLSFSFVFVAAAVFLLILGVRKQDVNLRTLIGLSLIAGGGIGNLIDRLWNVGAVVDFMRVGIGRVHTGIFNFADVAILTGAIVVLIMLSNGGRKKGAT